MPNDDVISSNFLDRRKFLLGVALVASAAITLARRPRTRIDYLGSTKLDALIPKGIGRWNFATTSGLVVPTDDALSDSLYSQLLTRVYVDRDNPPVMLLIAQSAGQTGFLQIHRPEACYPAGGYELSAPETRSINANGRSVPITQMTATGQGRQEQILYWTRIGDSMPESWAQQRLAVAQDNLKGIIPDAILVRVSTVDPDKIRAVDRLATFIENMVAALPANGQRVLLA